MGEHQFPKTQTALECAKQHPNWNKHKAFTLEEAASCAILNQTVINFRYLKAIFNTQEKLEENLKAAINVLKDLGK